MSTPYRSARQPLTATTPQLRYLQHVGARRILQDAAFAMLGHSDTKCSSKSFMEHYFAELQVVKTAPNDHVEARCGANALASFQPLVVVQQVASCEVKVFERTTALSYEMLSEGHTTTLRHLRGGSPIAAKLLGGVNALGLAEVHTRMSNGPWVLYGHQIDVRLPDAPLQEIHRDGTHHSEDSSLGKRKARSPPA
jgi:hypothetical protein